MTQRIVRLIAAIAGILVLSGCATMGKNDELSNQGLRNKVSALEAQLAEKDNEINSLKESLGKIEQEASQIGEVKQRLSVKQIQAALANAGYFQDTVDGKMGAKTRQAIKDFQKANNLQVDGRVGRNTSLALREYLDKKIK